MISWRCVPGAGGAPGGKEQKGAGSKSAFQHHVSILSLIAGRGHDAPSIVVGRVSRTRLPRGQDAGNSSNKPTRQMTPPSPDSSHSASCLLRHRPVRSSSNRQRLRRHWRTSHARMQHNLSAGATPTGAGKGTVTGLGSHRECRFEITAVVASTSSVSSVPLSGVSTIRGAAQELEARGLIEVIDIERCG